MPEVAPATNPIEARRLSRPDIAELIAFWGGITCCAAVLGPFVLWGSKLPFAEAIFFMPGALCCMAPIILIVAAWRREWKLVCLNLLGAAVALSVYAIDPVGQRSLESNFAVTRQERTRALAWLRSQKAKSQPIKLPSSFAPLTFKGEAFQFKEGQDAWVFLPMYRFGIDNEFGYAWSKTGKPPPRRSRLELVRSRPMGEGWFIYETT